MEQHQTYTEEDMIRMQQEAINRVHEFQARSQAATQQFIDVLHRPCSR